MLLIKGPLPRKQVHTLILGMCINQVIPLVLSTVVLASILYRYRSYGTHHVLGGGLTPRLDTSSETLTSRKQFCMSLLKRMLPMNGANDTDINTTGKSMTSNVAIALNMLMHCMQFVCSCWRPSTEVSIV